VFRDRWRRRRRSRRREPIDRQVTLEDVALQDRSADRVQGLLAVAGQIGGRWRTADLVVARLAVHWASGMTKRTLKVRIRTATG
jgi:hypothetical protein